MTAFNDKLSFELCFSKISVESEPIKLLLCLTKLFTPVSAIKECSRLDEHFDYVKRHKNINF